MSAEHMNHVSALLFSTLAVYFFLGLLETPSPRGWALAGLTIGGFFLTRLLNAVAIAIPILVYEGAALLHPGARAQGKSWRGLCVFFGILLCAVGLQLRFNEGVGNINALASPLLGPVPVTSASSPACWSRRHSSRSGTAEDARRRLRTEILRPKTPQDDIL